MPTATQQPPTRGPQGPGTSGGPPRSRFSSLLATRRGTVAVAVVAGLSALAVLLVFMANYRSSVRDESASVPVLVASRQLDSGTSGEVIAENGLYKEIQVRGDEAASGAFSNVDALRGKHTTATIDANQQLTAADFAAGADPVTGKLEGTQRALSVPLDSAHGNIGQVRAGSRVEVLGSFNAEPLGGRAGSLVTVLARDALVLSAPAKSEGGIGSSKSEDVVLRLSDVEAARVAYASDQGHVWLAIRPPTLAKDSSGLAGGAKGGE
jgi:Flp pilus assembly protein CpaB